MNALDRAALLDRFTAAWSARDLDELMAMMAEDCTFRASVGPEPGATFTGPAEVRRGFRLFLGPADSEAAVETVSETPLISGDFAVTRWTSRISPASGAGSVVRACDILGFEGDRIKFKDTYRKVLATSPT